MWPVPEVGTEQDDPQPGDRGAVARPVSIRDGRDGRATGQATTNGHGGPDTDLTEFRGERERDSVSAVPEP
jgi:hypothetical protein